MEPFEIAVSRTRCDASGHCAELLPELIRLDDWGYPIVAPGAVPRHLAEHARWAVASCPALALKLRRLSANSQDRLRSLPGSGTSMGP